MGITEDIDSIYRLLVLPLIPQIKTCSLIWYVIRTRSHCTVKGSKGWLRGSIKIIIHTVELPSTVFDMKLVDLFSVKGSKFFILAAFDIEASDVAHNKILLPSIMEVQY